MGSAVAVKAGMRRSTVADFDVVPVTLKIDIGADGGVLEIDQSQPETTYKVNGAGVTEADAWVWIYNWHMIRDAVTEADPCMCQPCVWYRTNDDHG